MTDDESKVLLRRLHDKLDDHTRDTAKRWEEHEKEHRQHDREHSEIAQRQLKVEDRLHAGAATMQELRERTKPPSWSVIAAAVLAVIGLPVGAVIWINSGLSAKADKSVEEKISAISEQKADKSDVSTLSSKIDKLSQAIFQALEKNKTQR